jgi:glycosyltransferase involved in cell wall biosynthesis
VDRVPADKAADRPSILTVARLTQPSHKGHEYVLQAMPVLLSQFPRLTYHVVGDGVGRPALEAMADRLGVAHAMWFHGTVSDETLLRLYATASVFVMPSRCEGFGFVFIEAMAQGAPAVGGNVDATPEVIVDGQTGYVVDPTSVDGIVEAVARLLGDETSRQRMGQSAREHVLRNFGYARFRRLLVSYLSELCELPVLVTGAN